MTSQVDMEQLLDEIEQKQGKKRKTSKRQFPEEPTFDRDLAPWSWQHLAILVGITIVAGVLRLYRLGEWSLWIDEVHTLRDGVVKTPDEFWNSGTARYPVGFLLLRWLEPWLPSSGEGIWRLPFAFFGICSVPLLAIVGRRVVGVGPALLAALLLAFSPWHLFWSQSVRFYSIVLFFGLIASACFYTGVETGRRRWLLAALAFSGLAALSHPSAALVITGFVTFLVAMKFAPVRWPERLDSKAMLAFSLPLIVGGLVLLTTVTEAFEKYSQSKGGRESLMHLVNTTVWFVRIPIIVAACGGAFMLWQKSRRLTLFMGCMVVVPVLGVSVGSLFAQASAQYLFFTLPFWCLLAAYGAWEVVNRAEFQQARSLAIRAVVFGVILMEPVSQDYLYYHYRHGDRPKWRLAASYIQDHGNPEDMVASTNTPSLEWYLNPVRPMRESWTLEGEKRKRVELLADWTVSRLPEWSAKADETGRHIWLVGTPPTFQEADIEKVWYAWIRENCRQVLSLPNWLGPRDMSVQVWRYDPKPKSDASERPAPAAGKDS